MCYNTSVGICSTYQQGPVNNESGSKMKALKRFGKWIAVILFILITVTLIIFLYDFYTIITKSIESAAEENLKRNTAANALMIREIIQGDLDMVYALSGMLSGYESIDSPEARVFLKRTGNELPFSILVVSDISGNYYTTNGSEINLKNTEYLIGPTSGIKDISVVYQDALYGRDMIAMESPIYQNGRIIGKISGLYYTNYINAILDHATPEDEHNYQIVDRNGNFILSFGTSSFNKHMNLYEFLDSVSFTKESSADEIIHNFINKKPGVSTYLKNGKAYYLSYVPIGIKDWYLISDAPNTGINLLTVNTENPTIILAFRIIILFIVLILYIIWRQTRYRITMEKSREELEILNERLKVKNETLKLKAENDLLTGLYNKVTSELTITSFLLNEGREGRHALLVIDLDNFKQINDELGHFYGDKALTEAANGIAHCLRTTDIKGRFGGDEFIVLMKNITSNGNLDQKTSELSRIINEIEITENMEWKLSASIGAAIYPDHAFHFKDLFRIADKAMYRSKELGKGTYYIYNDENVKG